MKYHLPVLIDTIDQLVNLDSNSIVIDATIGNGGHSLNFLKKGATVFGLDCDSANIDICKKRISKLGLDKKLTVIKTNFKNIGQVHQSSIKRPVDLIFFDLGLSQNQQKATNRGFSFTDHNSLDMRIDPSCQTVTAKTVVNSYSQSQIFDILSKFGQEKHSQQIAISLVSARKRHPFQSSFDLSNHIKKLFLTNNYPIGKIHPATKTFLALKLFVNQEIDNLKKALDICPSILKKNGRLAVISFHSTEDRVVKLFFRNCKQNHTLTKDDKFMPTKTEIKQNPLSRSAILRTAIKI